MDVLDTIDSKDPLREKKRKILLWMPVMKELEAMGYNPVRHMFVRHELTMKEIEDTYVAIRNAEAKYPKWNKVISEYVDTTIMPALCKRAV